VVVIDESIRDSPNLVAGANKVGLHLKNVNYPRDFESHHVADIAAAGEGYRSPVSGAPMMTRRAIEVGNIFKLGTGFSKTLNATYLDVNGKAQPVVMGSYGIGSGRNAASVAEQNYDERGLRWPISIAPFHVSLLSLGKEPEVAAAADTLYAELTAVGIEVLFDDRNDRPGVKFNDADLIGNPIRLSVSKRTLADGEAELRLRSEEESALVPIGDVVGKIQAIVSDLFAALQPA
jgi:prolyl-tRNA synthetase